MPYKHNEPRRHKIPKAKYKVENWREYNRALRQRGSLTVWVSPDALAMWTPTQTGRRGRPPAYSDLAIETGIMLRLAMGCPWRQTEGLLRSIVKLLGLDLPVPDYTTLARRSARLSRTTALKTPTGPVDVVIDSTGLKISGTGEWQHEKHGGRPRRSWRRLHLAIRSGQRGHPRCRADHHGRRRCLPSRPPARSDRWPGPGRAGRWRV